MKHSDLCLLCMLILIAPSMPVWIAGVGGAAFLIAMWIYAGKGD